MRIGFSVVLILLIVAMLACTIIARRSKKRIGKSVSNMLGFLIPPITGNLIIILSTNELLSTIGSYIYYIGMDFTIFALFRFTYDYCRISQKMKVFRLVINVLFLIDIIQLLLNPFFGHAFSIEGIDVDGALYFQMTPSYGQAFHRIVCYGVLFVSLIIFIVKMAMSPRIYYERYFVIILSIVVGTLWQTYYIFSQTPIDRSMIGFGAFGLMVFYFSLFYRSMRLLDRMLATIASEIPDALFFFDNNKKCIWVNSPGAKLLDIKGTDYDSVGDLLTSRFGEIDDTSTKWSNRYITGDGDTVKSYVLERRVVTDENKHAIGAFLSVRDNSDDQKILSNAIYKATHDSLTDVFNRAGYDLLVLDLDLKSTIMLIADVDNFKDVNDNFGHEVGDKALQKVAKVLKHSFRVDESICRMGGDEFVIFMPKTDRGQVEFIKKCVESVNEELGNTTDGIPSLSISVGVAIGKKASDINELFKRADYALYETKRNGRSGVTFFD